MATLILSTVGAVFGGRFGQSIGKAVGQLIDSQLFPPKGREGPRLGDLAVQTSSYGMPIPKLFGVTRVAGTVIWATPLRETRTNVSNGKGKPKTAQFSYSVSFAVALSARAIIRIGRIWADGKLLRGAAGDFKTQVQFRLHSGGEGQALDPLIASVEGIANCPAYRGLAYAVFENLDLAEFGNRIPSLSFEVIADENAVTTGAVIADLANGAVIADCPTAIGGFAAYGQSVRAAIETLASAVSISSHDDGARLQIFETGTSADPVRERDLGTSRGEERVARIATERRSASTIPETLSITYYEPARDFQQSVQRVRRDGGARRVAKIELPVVLDPSMAKALADRRLDRMWAERVAAKIALPWRRFDLRPGQQIIIDGGNARWRVTAITLDRMIVAADLVRMTQSARPFLLSEPGRSLGADDRIHGPTRFELIDLPPLIDGIATAPNLVVAAAGASPGWRSAALLVSTDGGSSWQDGGTTAAPAIIGSAVGVLGTSSALIEDRINNVVVTLLHAEMHLGDAGAGSLDGLANLAMLGDELIQFSTAVPLGSNQYRLSDLRRGRRGTEWAIGGHVAGERFVMIDRDTLVPIAVSAGTPEVRVMAIGIGDAADTGFKSALNPQQAIVPPAPVHLSIAAMPDGSKHISWIRRSRDGWRWIDYADAPLGEEKLCFDVTFYAGVVRVRQVEISVASFRYNLAMQAADGATTMTIVQRGDFGVSRATSINL